MLPRDLLTPPIDIHRFWRDQQMAAAGEIVTENAPVRITGGLVRRISAVKLPF